MIARARQYCREKTLGRRGMAMLVVLGTLVVAVTACATLACRAATAATAARFRACRHAADDLALAADRPILHWLNVNSLNVVLPPEALHPEVEVACDEWVSENDLVSLRVTAYDQCGMLPIELLGSPLYASLPRGIRDDLKTPPSILRARGPAGLDMFEPQTCGGVVPLFPSPNGDIPSHSDPPADRQPRSRSPGTNSPALGALIGTHNPGCLLNVNTAPMPLVEAALSAQGRGGLDEIRRARLAGEPALVPPLPAARRAMRAGGPVLSAASHIWAFRIDATVGPVRRSLWTLFSAESGEWHCVQRLVIDQ